MFTYWIAGVPIFMDFCHAMYIAEKLKRSLPHFSYTIIVKTEEEYQVTNVKYIILKSPGIILTLTNIFLHTIG